jgi:hypothetical protein
LQEARETEIENLQPAVRGEPQIPRLEIAVHDPALVERDQTVRQLDPDPPHLVVAEAALANQGIDRSPGHELHHEEIDAVIRVEVVNGRDVGMIEPRQRQRFLLESGAAFVVGEAAVRQQLECDVAIETLVARPVHDAHPAGADSLQDPVVAQRPSMSGSASGIAGCYHRSVASTDRCRRRQSRLPSIAPTRAPGRWSRAASP